MIDETVVSTQILERKKKEYPHLSTTLWYRGLSEDSVESLIFSLQFLLAIALGRRPA
jgi:hypothetical protein